MKHIVLYFGSFNPIHTGHLIVAGQVVARPEVDELWWVVSPQNPFKIHDDLWKEDIRLSLVTQSIAADSRFKVCDIEFELPRPSYTIDTLTELMKRFPDTKFSLLMGADNLPGLQRWKDADTIIQNHTIYVYPRHGDFDMKPNPSMILLDTPMIDISATWIRQLVEDGKSIKYIVPGVVEIYIENLRRLVK